MDEDEWKQLLASIERTARRSTYTLWAAMGLVLVICLVISIKSLVQHDYGTLSYVATVAVLAGWCELRVAGIWRTAYNAGVRDVGPLAVSLMTSEDARAVYVMAVHSKVAERNYWRSVYALPERETAD